MLDNPIQQATLHLTTTTPRPTLLGFRLLLVIPNLLGTLGTQKPPVWPRLAVGRDREAFPAQLAVVQLARHGPRPLAHHLPGQSIVVCVCELLDASGLASREILALFDAVQGAGFLTLAFLLLLGGFAFVFFCFKRCCCCMLLGFFFGCFLFGFLDSSLVVFVDLLRRDIVGLESFSQRSHTHTHTLIRAGNRSGSYPAYSQPGNPSTQSVCSPLAWHDSLQ